jgi:hypothetical protein
MPVALLRESANFVGFHAGFPIFGNYFQSFFAELWLFGHTLRASGHFQYFLAM